ncbi:MFS transporter, CP family, cyanate transporter [Goodfellowiella coeruleoviolacea]|uniref:MFS transporter, CP family, cyanate transporter n=2 Tax=Goodfellowiella coeruleoviolacea TaxID=334858 RepID=A0AAE3GK40_9PSEU|nr:MFS transporter, CP family, cyanate transporter [Goodfellowiella coeruleoviolacea]
MGVCTADPAAAEALPNTGAAEPVFTRRHVALLGTPLLAVGVALTAANLRPAVTSLSSVLGDVRTALGASNAWMSVVTAVPTLCFGLAAFAAPWLGRRLGMARAVALSLVLVTAGLLVRVADGIAGLLVGTFVACAGIAVSNVLIPVVVKDSFGRRVGLVTGVYTAALAAGGTLGAALTPPLETASGNWRISVGGWSLLAVLALVMWLVGARHGAPTQVADGTPAAARRSLLRVPLAWVMTVFFGLQSLLAYVVMGWLPQLLQDSGVDRTTAGLLLAVTMVLGVPVSLVVPLLATRRPGQSWLVLLLGALTVAGLVGLTVAPTWLPALWIVLLGIGMGMFPLALTMISLRTRNSADTAQLSAMTQSIGYLIGAVGPLLFGIVHDVTGGWTTSLVGLLALVVVLVGLGVVAGRPRQI